MRNLPKIIFLMYVICVITAINGATVFAADVHSYEYIQDNSVFENLKGQLEITKDSYVSVKDERACSVTTTTVKVNTPQIRGEGDVKISNNSTKKYENIKSNVLVDINIGIDAPIVTEGTNVEIENHTTTDIEDCDIDKVYTVNKYYGKVTEIPDVTKYQQRRN